MLSNEKPKSDTMKSEKDKLLANRIKSAYSKYQIEKQKLVPKKHLLPEKDNSNSEQPLPKYFSKETEKRALFLNVDTENTNIFFKKCGVDTLFRTSSNGKASQLNMGLLQFYLDKGTNITPWVLEAYLRDMINSDTLISLFMLQHAVVEFDGVTKKSNSSLKLYPIHCDGQLTSETYALLVPYFLRSSPQRVLDDYSIGSFLDSISVKLMDIEELDNYFGLVELTDEQLCTYAYYIYSRYITRKEAAQDVFNAEFKNLKSLFQYLAEKFCLQLDLNDRSTPTKKLLLPLFEKLEGKMLEIAKKDNPDLTQETIASYMNQHIELLHLAIDEGLGEADEFIPIEYQVNINGKNELKFGFIVINCETQDIWLRVASGRTSAGNIKKVPMFGSVSLKTLHQMTQQEQRPIGLAYDGLPIPATVHGSIAKPYAYLLHDLRFHYQLFFYLLALGKASYELSLLFVKTILATTGLDVTDTVISILDFSNSYFAYGFDERYATKREVIKEIPKVDLFKLNEKYASLEYALIVICDLIKDEKKYIDLLSSLPGLVEPLVNYKEVFMLEMLGPYGYSKKKQINPILKVSENIKNYSHSLGVFMCLLQLNKFDQKEVEELCAKLNALINANSVEFKWNKKAGLMLDVGTQSFRLRKAKNDYRHQIMYPDNGKDRLFSDQAGWWETLKQAIDEKYRELSNRKTPS